MTECNKKVMSSEIILVMMRGMIISIRLGRVEVNLHSAPITCSSFHQRRRSGKTHSIRRSRACFATY